MFPTTLALLSSRLWVACKSVVTLGERRVVGKPQVLSRLRYVNIVKRADETDEEQAYRTQYESLQDWNNKYWAENNELFTREKNEYIKTNFGENSSSDEALSHDQLAPFYKSFLQRNRDKHVVYNKVWYKNHAALLYSSANAKLSRLKANISIRRED